MNSSIDHYFFSARTLENDLTTTEEEMTREELIKYLESIDLAKTFGGKSIDEQTPNDDKLVWNIN